MATAQVEIELPLAADEAWALVGDYGAARELAPGFVMACELEGDERIVTFASGLVARERLVTRDAGRRRLVYAAVGGRAGHHNAAMEVIDLGPRGSAIRWTTDVLPDALAPLILGMMQQGGAAIAQGAAAAARIPARTAATAEA